MLLSVIAVVDIGSNSVKVLVAKMQHGKMEEVHLDAETTSLARGLPQTGELSAESRLLTLKTLERFHSKIKELRVPTVKVLATAAMREAKNGRSFAEEIKNIFQVPVDIISGLEEAEISLAGAMTARPAHIPEKACLFADLGGASTEIGYSSPQKQLVSTSLGALKTHNALGMGGHAISNSDWKKANDYVWSLLEQEIPAPIKDESTRRQCLIAVGGTIVMATASLGLSPFMAACYQFKRQDLENFADRLRKIDEVERCQIPHLKKDRADILPFGIMVLTQIMKYLGQENGISTVRGLRHGYAQKILES